MNAFILNLADPQADLETTGGKGASLARMLQGGLPVPGGFHVTTEAYRCFVHANGLQEKILAVLSGVDVNSTAALDAAEQAIRQGFAAGSMPAEIAEAVLQAYAGLKEAPVAVRSSATAEDLPDASFAGQQETFLNVRGAEAVLAAVRRCWGSLWTARAIAYRIKNEIDQNAVSLAVVVQELVFADAAGILFTANPLNGKRDELVINAAWGLGEAVVSGAVTPDTLTVNKLNGKVVRRELADKQVMTVRTEAGTEEQPVPEEKRKKPALTPAQTRELTELGVKIEQFYGMPMDVEWALAGGKFAIVQARPITAMPPEWKMPVSKAVYGRGSLAEHTPSPVTPLFATLGLEAANKATAEMWYRIIGKSAEHMIPEGGMYIPINGYVFGGVRMTARDIAAIIRMSFSNMNWMMRGSIERWQAARKELAPVVAGWEQKPVEQMGPSELLEGVESVLLAACRYFTHIQTTLPAASMSEILFTRFYNSLVRRKVGVEASTFLMGFENQALRAEKSLYDLSQWIKGTPELCEYVLNTETAKQLADLDGASAPDGAGEEAWQEMRARFQQHMHTFGRTAYEFDFAFPTPLETPGPVLDALKNYLSGSTQNPYERQQATVDKREEATQNVLERTGWPVRGWFKRLVGWAQSTAPMREDSIFDMGMGHPLLRRMLNELGRRFAAAGAIDQADEIYWLEKSEVVETIQALEAGRALTRLSERIPARKEEWETRLRYSAPVILPERTGWSKLVHGDEAERKDGKVVLKGVGTSGGKITAPACVLFGPENFNQMKPGDVLVAVTTTPAWTPLFGMASAVVTDIGGPLSHSSIVAREYGIPAVMAARGATRTIENGQMVTVDGAAGTVTLE